MRALKVDLAQLAAALEYNSWETHYYLDLETGEIVLLTDETFHQLEEIYEEAEAGEPLDLAAYLERDDQPAWQKQDVLLAAQVEDRGRYAPIEADDPHEGYRDMEDFIATVRDDRLQKQLWRAIRGRGAFGRFKDILARRPDELERWFEFTDRLNQQRALDWLVAEGIEPIIKPEPVREPTPPSPPVRLRLLAEVLAFVRAAGKLPGITRIALIGSLTTDKAEPKDADMLVTVTDEADLALLATLSRQLSGHAQSFGRNGDVFLADPSGNYLGRTCPWKRCGPGIRASCDALHCGQRPYLHDDFKDIRLTKNLIAAPPIELWPEVMARAPVPADVEEHLLILLKTSNKRD